MSSDTFSQAHLSALLVSDPRWVQFVRIATTFLTPSSPTYIHSLPSSDPLRQLFGTYEGFYGLGLDEPVGSVNDALGPGAVWDKMRGDEREAVLDVLGALTPDIYKDPTRFEDWESLAGYTISGVFKKHGWQVSDVADRFGPPDAAPRDLASARPSSTARTVRTSTQPPTVLVTQQTQSTTPNSTLPQLEAIREPALSPFLLREPRWKNFVLTARAFFSVSHDKESSDGMAALCEAYYGLGVVDLRMDDKIGVVAAWDAMSKKEREGVLSLLGEFTQEVIGDEGQLSDWMRDAAHEIDELCAQHGWAVSEIVDRFMHAVHPTTVTAQVAAPGQRPAQRSTVVAPVASSQAPTPTLSDDEDDAATIPSDNDDTTAQPKLSPSFANDPRWVAFDGLATHFMEDTSSSSNAAARQASSDLSDIYSEICTIARSSTGKNSIWDNMTPQQRDELLGMMAKLTPQVSGEVRKVDDWIVRAADVVHKILMAHELTENDIDEGNLSDEEEGHGQQPGETFEGVSGGFWITSR